MTPDNGRAAACGTILMFYLVFVFRQICADPLVEGGVLLRRAGPPTSAGVGRLLLVSGHLPVTPGRLGTSCVALAGVVLVFPLSSGLFGQRYSHWPSAAHVSHIQTSTRYDGWTTAEEASGGETNASGKVLVFTPMHRDKLFF